MIKWLGIGAAALVILGVLALWVVPPALRKGRVEDFLKLDRELSCCTSGRDRTECREALRDLVDLARKEPLARGAIEGCAVAEEMDASRPHPPEQRLCGLLTSFEDRRTAARELGLKLPDVAASRKCNAEGRDAALAMALQDFDAVCGPGACVKLLALTPAEAKARRLASEHPVALLLQLSSHDVQMPAEVRRSLVDAAFPQQGAAIWALLKDDSTRPEDLNSLLNAEKPDLQGLKVVRGLGGPEAARSQLVAWALGTEPMTPEEQGAACRAASCGFLGAFTREKLKVDEPLRREACAARYSECSLRELILLPDGGMPDAGAPDGGAP